MIISKRFFAVLVCFSLLFLAPIKNESLAACGSDPNADSVKVAGYAYTSTSIQDAYNYASTTLNLPSFTLQLAGQIFTEDLTIDKGAVVLDGGWDCSFATKTSPSSVFGTITIKSTGSLIATANTEAPRVVSTNQTTFDRDGDGFTSIGSTSGSADDCNDNDFAINPGAVEICDGLDNNCDGQADEGLTGTDADGDGYYAEGSCAAIADDCNDNDGTINPGAVEIPYDGIDQDCNEVDLTFANGDSCVPCHDPDNLLDSSHSYRPSATDNSCVLCHAGPVSSVLSGHYGKTVRTTDNGVAANSTINCWTCHDDGNHSGEFALGDGQGDVWNDVSPPYPGNYTCDNCHASRAARHATATAHNNRVIDGSCASCHTSDTTVLGSPGTGTLTSAADVDALHGVQQATDCALCHAYSGTKLDAAVVQQTISQGLSGTQVSCLDCHTDKGTGHGNFTHPIEVGPNDLSYNPGQLCSNCHVVANWAEIEGTEHNVATNGAGSCATCHNSTRQIVQNIIADAPSYGGYPIRCLACHADKELTAHGSVDHVSTTYVTGGTTFCLDCHDPGTAANATVDVTHGGDCTLCHTTVPALQTGVPAGGGDCVTCHTVPWRTLHITNPPDHSSLVTTTGTNNCASCHADALIDVTTHLSNCSNCHDADTGALAVTYDTHLQTFATGGNCETCHTEAWEATHTTNTPDHGFLVRVDATSCADCHSDPPPLTDNADPKVHNLCSSCHNTDGSLVTLYDTNLQTFIAGGDCATCHTTGFDAIHATSHTHTVALGAGDLSFEDPGTSCGDCHVVANWTEIEGTEHNVATNGAGSCATCHNSSRQEVIDAIALGADPTNCLACHGDKLLTVHGSIDHVASTDVTLATACASCHDPGTAANATVDITHGANCTLCHTTVPDLQPGVPAGGGDCATCHPATWATTHTSNTPDHSSLVTTTGTDNCVSCHADALIDASTHLSDCSNCHNGDGSLVTTYNTNLQTFLAGGNCETCHTLGWESTHFANNNGTTTHNALVQVAATACATCHSDPPPLTDNADSKVHNLCSSCHAANGSLVTTYNTNLQTFATGGDCATCHGSNWGTLHTAPDHSSLVTTTGTDNCATCHADALIDASTHLSDCSNCHNGDGSLVTTYNTNLQTFLAGGNCQTCHTLGWESTHFANNNGFTTHNALVQVAATACATCHSDPPPLTDNADSKVHNLCSSCHAANGSLVTTYNTNLQTFATGGDCATCHGSNWGTLHTAPDHSSLVTTTGTDNCATCHADALIDASTHLSDCSNCHNGDGSLVTTYNTNLQTFLAGGNCQTCHTGTWKTLHTPAPTHISLVQVAATDCADCHSNPPPLINASDPKVHNDCTTCHTSNGNLVATNGTNNQDFGTGGTCATCHGGNVQTAHPNCSACHGEPPSGTTAPNRDRAHSEHDVLGFGTVNPSCNACHNSAAHYDGSTQVNIPSSFDDKDFGSPSFNGSTCSNTRCHGGQTTPSWSSGSLNVDTQCRSCHNDRRRGSDQYNDYYSGEHDKHVRGENAACTDCHSISKLANGNNGNTHFSNLQTTSFELSPGLTVGGSDTVLGNTWNNSSNTCSNLTCHGETHDSGMNW